MKNIFKINKKKIKTVKCPTCNKYIRVHRYILKNNKDPIYCFNHTPTKKYFIS